MGKYDLDDVLKDLDEEFGPEITPIADDEPASTSSASEARRHDDAPTRPESTAAQDTGASQDHAAFHPPAVEPEPEPPNPAEVAAEQASHQLQDLAEIYSPDEAQKSAQESPELTALLLQRNQISAEQVATGARVAKQSPGRPLSQILVEIGVSEVAVQQAVAELAGLPFEQIDFDSNELMDYKAFKRLGPEYCKNHLVLPLRQEGTRLVVGTCSPDDVFILDDIKRKIGVAGIKHVLLTGYDVRGAIELMDEPEEEYDVDELLADVDEDDVEVLKDEVQDADVEDAESSPVVRYVNHIIQTAVKEGASDIHVEPNEKTMTVRFRIDGVLFEMMHPPRKMHAALTSRLKIMANLDIAERRLPQDGRIRVTVNGRKLDLRVSTVPTPYGEKTVMRILDTRSINVSLDELGFGEDTLTIWKNQIAQPHGIILVTGPTGSGKTTTLYASIKQMDLRKLNVSTVEDPVEYNLGSITQIQTHERIGMTFAKALKALLRQDPDVIMVGEIRDMETATTAVQAALTGHLVLSTLHTNDAPSSITRLINIGTEPFLVGAAVNAVLAQRLVRRICDNCKQETEIKPEIQEFLDMHGISKKNLMYGKGCSKCRETGYSGRNGLYELLVLDDALRDAIARSPNVTEFRRTCCERGMVTLREDGFRKVDLGITTVEEILRVTESTI
ncbi:MAG: type II/IV secretion system protein [Phycisphaerales bacterium]|nr:MAG: type II/IV secretion system protein [Phycisphaerales bacterium]